MFKTDLITSGEATKDHPVITRTNAMYISVDVIYHHAKFHLSHLEKKEEAYCKNFVEGKNHNTSVKYTYKLKLCNVHTK